MALVRMHATDGNLGVLLSSHKPHFHGPSETGQHHESCISSHAPPPLLLPLSIHSPSRISSDGPKVIPHLPGPLPHPCSFCNPLFLSTSILLVCLVFVLSVFLFFSFAAATGGGPSPNGFRRLCVKSSQVKSSLCLSVLWLILCHLSHSPT